jgi:hypothetical protein
MHSEVGALGVPVLSVTVLTSLLHITWSLLEPEETVAEALGVKTVVDEDEDAASKAKS